MHFVIYIKYLWFGFPKEVCTQLSMSFTCLEQFTPSRKIEKCLCLELPEASPVSVTVSEEKAVCHSDILSSFLTFEFSSLARVVNFSFV